MAVNNDKHDVNHSDVGNDNGGGNDIVHNRDNGTDKDSIVAATTTVREQ